MAPPYLRRLLVEYGTDLATKAYLYADPFSRPGSLTPGHYTVADPSFDQRPVPELVKEFAWMHERTLPIRDALLGRRTPMVSAARYVHLLEFTDPMGH